MYYFKEKDKTKKMKSIISSFLVLLFAGLSVLSASGQTINKKTLLADLNNADGMTLDSKQKKDYEAANTKTANSLIELDKKSLPKEERDKEVDKIFDRRDKEVDGILGIDDKLEDTRKTYKKKTRKLRLQMKAAKLVL